MWCLGGRRVWQGGWRRGLAGRERWALGRHRHRETGVQSVIARALLRRALAAYGGAAAGLWRIQADAAGKPKLQGPAGIFQFSVTHTRGMVACIVAKRRAAGIDCEWLGRAVPSVESIVLSDREHAELSGADARARHAMFFLIWTVKEAFGKAVGAGLAAPLDELTLRGTGRRLRLCASDGAGMARNWRLGSLRLGAHRVSWACAPGPRRWVSATRLWSCGPLRIYGVA